MPKKKVNKKKKNNKLNKIIKKLKKNNFKFNFVEIVTIVIISIALGTIIGGSITYKKENATNMKVSEDIEEFITTYNNVYNNYYKKVKKEELIDAAIEGMINSLDDPYSSYMNEATTETFNQTVNGEYVGIGVTVKLEKENIEIIDLFASSPAKKAGLKKGDKIKEINNESIKDKTLDEVVSMVKGKEGTKVLLKILRDDKEMNFEVTRKSVDIPSVTSKVIKKENKKIGYITLEVFAANTYEQFSKNLEKLENRKIDSLIIDVRNNPGGHLDQVTKILELFLDKDKILYQIKSKKKIEKIYSTTKEKRQYKIVVLINSSSASASEILAGAIKESYNGDIVGTKSYGKGTVQNAYELKSGTSIKYTTQKWLTPKGNSIDKKGIIPTENIELSEEYINNPTEENDNQLQKAIDIIIK